MPDYRRPPVSLAPVFFTVCLADRSASSLLDHLDILREAVRITKRDRPFDILAWIVLPDHMHAVWRLPPNDPNYSQRWGRIKARFTRDLRVRLSRPGLGPETFPEEFPEITSGRFAGLKPGLRVEKRERAVWQRRFWEHHCRDEADLRAHIRYCWSNPVKHGLVARPTDWDASSIHRDIRLGRCDPGWAGQTIDGDFGEAT
jgi:putative transposase